MKGWKWKGRGKGQKTKEGRILKEGEGEGRERGEMRGERGRRKWSSLIFQNVVVP